MLNLSNLFYRIKDFADEDKNDGKSDGKEATSTNDVPTDAVVKAKNNDNSPRKITRNQKRRHDEINHVQKVSTSFVTSIFLLPSPTNVRWIYTVTL